MSFAPVSRQEPSTFTGDFIMTHRKSAFELTAAEQNRFLQVITAMNTDNDPTLYAQFVGIHADMRHHMHTGMGGGAVGRQRFLPWHRDFLLKFETAMQQIDPAAFIPYWHWSTDRALPPWQADPANQAKRPGLSPTSAILDPWDPDTVNTVASITTLEYDYI